MTLANVASVLQTPTFKKAVKKLRPNQKKELDAAIKTLMKDPKIGKQKKGDLSFLRVHKFKRNKQLTLLGYSYNEGIFIFYPQDYFWILPPISRGSSSYPSALQSSRPVFEWQSLHLSACSLGTTMCEICQYILV